MGYPPVLPALLAHDGEALAALLRRVHNTGATTSLDLSVVDPDSAAAQLNWRAILTAALPHTDVISPSIDNLIAMQLASRPHAPEIEHAARWLLDHGAAVVMISAGRRGAHLATAGHARLATGGKLLARLTHSWITTSLWIDALQVARPVSTNGAGDTLTAGLLYGLLQQWGPVRTGYFAAQLAAARMQDTPLAALLDEEHTVLPTPTAT